MARHYEQDPDAELDWTFDWTQWLASSETITASTFTIDAGMTAYDDSFSSYTTTVWLKGGAPGTPYRLTNRITTNEGRTDERSITIRVNNR